MPGSGASWGQPGSPATVGPRLEVSAAAWMRAGREAVFRAASSLARLGSCLEGGRPAGRQRLRSARRLVEEEGRRTRVCAWAGAEHTGGAWLQVKDVSLITTLKPPS